MTHWVNRTIASALAVFCAATTAVTAQVAAGAPQGVCGTELFGSISSAEYLANTARLNPALYARMVADHKAGRTARVQGMPPGDPYTFKMMNRVTRSYYDVEAILYYEGPKCRIWVDSKDTNTKGNQVTVAKIQPLIDALETKTPAGSRNTAQGILDNDVQVFGAIPHPPLAFDNKIDFLMTDIIDGFTGGNAYVAGFFSPTDQDAQNLASNQMNLLYIDCNKSQGLANLTNVAGTMAHEFQHLIHYNTNKNSETFPNEGCSEVASILNGYRDRSNAEYNANTNVPLFQWSASDNTAVLADYSRAMTFIHYMREQFGDPFLTKLASAKTTGAQRFTDALAGIGRSQDFNYVLKGFGVANYLQRNGPDARYSFKLAIGGAPSAAASVTRWTGAAYPASNDVPLVGYGIRYNIFDAPGSVLTFKLNATDPCGVMAILYRGAAAIEVRELKVDNATLQTLEFAPGRAYDKIVLVFVNLLNASQTISWTVTSAPSSVNAPDKDAGSDMHVSISPNPVSGNTAVLNATLPVAGAVTVGLYDADGALVRSIQQDVYQQAGQCRITADLSGLASGRYTVRLSQNGRTAGQPLVLVR